MKNPEKVKQGKRNLAKGRRFELLVRKDLESKGWIVAKWTNNVEFVNNPYNVTAQKIDLEYGTNTCDKIGKLIPARQGKYRKTSTGFPDYFIYKLKDIAYEGFLPYDVTFVECKSNGYLSKEEKEKARWYLKNNHCSKFLIAKRSKKRGEIIYDDFSEKYKI